nr:PREDICTED: uncharacterized protein LOC105668590 [Linepithema humile]
MPNQAMEAEEYGFSTGTANNQSARHIVNACSNSGRRETIRPMVRLKFDELLETGFLIDTGSEITIKMKEMKKDKRTNLLLTPLLLIFIIMTLTANRTQDNKYNIQKLGATETIFFEYLGKTRIFHEEKLEI